MKQWKNSLTGVTLKALMDLFLINAGQEKKENWDPLGWRKRNMINDYINKIAETLIQNTFRRQLCNQNVFPISAEKPISKNMYVRIRAVPGMRDYKSLGVIWHTDKKGGILDMQI